MQPRKRKAVDAAGWEFGDAGDFLAMTEEERQLLDLRIDAALAVRRQREAMRLSQQELARRLHTSQPRVAKIEKAAKDVSLDQILRAFAAAGGRIAIKETVGEACKAGTRPAKKSVAGTGRVHAEVHLELTGRDPD
jgi:predicted XRE-type DNA-binding protein